MQEGIPASSQTACSVLFPLAKKQEFPRKNRPLKGIGICCSHWGLAAAEKAEIQAEPSLPQGAEPQWWPCFVRASGFAQVSPCTQQQKLLLPLPAPRGLQLCGHIQHKAACSVQDRAGSCLGCLGAGLELACLQCQPELGGRMFAVQVPLAQVSEWKRRQSIDKGMVQDRS